MSRNAKIAILLTVISCLFWAGLFSLPFIEMEGARKAKLGVALLICGEATFWGGALFVGRDLMKRYTSKLNPKNWSLWPKKD